METEKMRLCIIMFFMKVIRREKSVDSLIRSLYTIVVNFWVRYIA